MKIDFIYIFLLLNDKPYFYKMIEFKEGISSRNENYLCIFKSKFFLRKYFSNMFFKTRTAWLGYDLDTTGRVAILLDCHGIVGGLMAGSSVHSP